MPRTARVKRKTTETDITLDLNLDGRGLSDIKTGIPFFDHMLSLFSKHGLFDIKIKARGDIDVDFHHTVEDVGLTLGDAIKKALGNKKGIRRYGASSVPMMDALATVVLDMGGRPYLRFITPEGFGSFRKGREVAARFGIKSRDEFDMGLTEEFLKALSNETGMDLHAELRYGKNRHHSIEAVFKALARALKEAVEKDPRIKGVMSTKGKL
ncbi:MAG: imidazoleglycerol-phosphate dehydratase HisB [Deltaproteobacteria bacterium]|nr:imidazoleglycerol-phosphate dehydratase HisB [Deltaproteobacteria bacterium]